MLSSTLSLKAVKFAKGKFLLSNAVLISILASLISVARENNISNVADYAKFAEEQCIKAAEKAAQDAVLAAEKERQAKEEAAKCLDGAHCYASKHKAGDYICKVAVENSAQCQFK